MVNFNAVKNLNLNIKLGNKQRIGILNEGKDNKFIDNTFSNLDIGIKDEGKNTIAVGNKFE